MQNTVSAEGQIREFYGKRIEIISKKVRSLLSEKQAKGHQPKLTKRERTEVIAQLTASELPAIRAGVNFSRMQATRLLQFRDTGKLIEFETLGPYLASYTASDGVMTMDNLVPEDAIGLRLATLFRDLFPQARLISLYDDYNAHSASEQNSADFGAFSNKAKHNFVQSLKALFGQVGAVPPGAIEGEEYLLIPETSKVAEAEMLVKRLDDMGRIRRNDKEIIFLNEYAENPLHTRLTLRTKSGKWLCEALDAAGFLKEENLEIVHIVVLPEYMKDQQDKLWEILRTFSFRPDQYHNIFYDPQRSPEHVARTIGEEFRRVAVL